MHWEKKGNKHVTNWFWKWSRKYRCLCKILKYFFQYFVLATFFSATRAGWAKSSIECVHGGHVRARVKRYVTQRCSEIHISHEVPLYGAPHQDGCRNLYAARRTAGVTSARANGAGEGVWRARSARACWARSWLKEASWGQTERGKQPRWRR